MKIEGCLRGPEVGNIKCGNAGSKKRIIVCVSVRKQVRLFEEVTGK